MGVYCREYSLPISNLPRNRNVDLAGQERASAHGDRTDSHQNRPQRCLPHNVFTIVDVAVQPLPPSLMSFPPPLCCSALSARLGLGKGGLRMAPPEALAHVLQVRSSSPPSLCFFLLTSPLLPLRCPLGRAAPWPSGSALRVRWGCCWTGASTHIRASSATPSPTMPPSVSPPSSRTLFRKG